MRGLTDFTSPTTPTVWKLSGNELKGAIRMVESGPMYPMHAFTYGAAHGGPVDIKLVMALPDGYEEVKYVSQG